MTFLHRRILFFFSSRRRHTRCLSDLEFRRVLFRSLSAGGESRPVAVGLVGGDFFSTLGVRPVVGRTLTDADDQRGCAPVAVITHAFWQSERSEERRVGKECRSRGWRYRHRKEREKE